jgi:ribonuclease P protein component
MSRGAHHLTGHYISIDIRHSQEPTETRLGITVTRRFGEANVRNRFKRLIREAFRLVQHDIPRGLDLNVRPRTGAETATLKEIQEELLRLIQREH